MTEVYRDLLLVLIGPVALAAVVGAWITTGRLFLARFGGPRLPRWMPWVISSALLLAALVVTATQLITLSTGTGTGISATPTAERTAAVVVALLLSPAWIAAASLAVLGTALHYVLDDLLRLLSLRKATRDGLALGVRGAWLAVGLLTLFGGLQRSYSAVMAVFYPTIEYVLGQAGNFQLVLHVLAVLLAVLGMVTPSLVEADK